MGRSIPHPVTVPINPMPPDSSASLAPSPAPPAGTAVTATMAASSGIEESMQPHQNSRSIQPSPPAMDAAASPSMPASSEIDATMEPHQDTRSLQPSAPAMEPAAAGSMAASPYLQHGGMAHATSAVLNGGTTQSTSAMNRRHRGKRPRTGPDYRLAPNEETAMVKAIRTAASRQGEPIFYPYEGTTFNSVTEAKEFYNLYSWEKGFGVRLHRGHRNRAEFYARQDIVCSCEGRPRHRNSASTRSNCKAKIRLLRGPGDCWYIKTVIDEHNHTLTEGYEENKQWPSHGDLDPLTKDLIRKLRENNVTLSRVCNILGVSNNATPTFVRKEAVRAWCAKLSQENLVDDMAKTMNLLQEMRKKDPLLEVRWRTNSDGTLNSIMWCTGKNRWDYSNFGDAITFDTTYRTNLYSLPFGMFVGVNHHFQSVIFGGVLVTTEKIADFHWAFSEFVDIMGGKAPATILTDQCAAMAAAIKTAMPNTTHRWCRWHVLKDAKKYLAEYFTKHSRFKSEFKELVTFETDQKEFEKRWKDLVGKYNLKKNRYLKRLYAKRRLWAKPYFMGIFCAGMTSTQRSESANHMLKTIIQKAAPMHIFVKKFSELQSVRKSDESTQNFATVQRNRKLTTTIPIERHANEVYTKTMYEHFSDQLYESGQFIVKDKPSATEFIVIDTRLEGTAIARDIHVKLEGDNWIQCDCGLFEHMGMLCRHAIKVLNNIDRRVVPAKNIVKRWTKWFDEDNRNNDYLRHLAMENDDLKRKAIVSKAFELANKESRISNFTYQQAIEALTQGTESYAGAASSAVIEKDSNVTMTHNFPTSCPPSTFKGGRPPNTGQKSWLDSIKKQKAQNNGEAEKEASDWPREENPPTKKRRSISEIMKP
ncbi:unnamed protein product [Urochloa decumbens]|uniref:Protein FAR1-RELATED SEQUENCE n=1 Tax=Urochloa decumbens TaxID=240449 RepID=A0ABC9BX85_9POAL